MWSSPDGYGSISRTYAFVAVLVEPLGVRDLERALALPDLLPLPLDLLRLVSLHLVLPTKKPLFREAAEESDDRHHAAR